jgi:hypothetical protein
MFGSVLGRAKDKNMNIKQARFSFLFLPARLFVNGSGFIPAVSAFLFLRLRFTRTSSPI